MSPTSFVFLFLICYSFFTKGETFCSVGAGLDLLSAREIFSCHRRSCFSLFCIVTGVVRNKKCFYRPKRKLDSKEIFLQLQLLTTYYYCINNYSRIRYTIINVIINYLGRLCMHSIHNVWISIVIELVYRLCAKYCYTCILGSS